MRGYLHRALCLFIYTLDLLVHIVNNLSMNLFYTDHNPHTAADSLPTKHLTKMPLECVQMLVSVLIRHGVEHNVRTKAGTIHRGGYKNHPCTVWAGDSVENARWMLQHGYALCHAFTRRYGKVHACQAQLDQCAADLCLANNGKGLSEFPQHEFTTPALAMPDGCKRDCPVHSYRRCIALKVLNKPDSFVWDGGRAEPEWLGAAVAEVDADRQKDPQAFE